jgi:hypothetical protein
MPDCLKYIDIFGQNFQFFIFGNEKFRTYFGASLACSTFILVIIFGFFFGSDFLYKQNPRIVSQIVAPNKYPPPLTLTPENFVIGWKISDSSVQFEGKIYPVITYYQILFNSSGTFDMGKENIKYSKCTNENAKVVEFSRYINNDYYCLDFTSNNKTFGGYWDGDYVNYFELVLFFCPQGSAFSENSNCTDLSIIQKMFGDDALYFDIVYPTFYFEPGELIKPLKIVYKDYFFSFNLNIQRTERIYFENVLLQDDQGWIMKNSKENIIRTTSKISTDLKFFNENNYGKENIPSSFYHLNFYTSKNYNKIERSFMKVQDFAAIMGGFIKIVTLFFGFFNGYVNKHLLKEEIFNRFFEYNLEKVERKSGVLNNSSIKFLMINKLSANIKFKAKNETHSDNLIINLKKKAINLQNENNNNINKLDESKIKNIGNLQSLKINSFIQINLSTNLKTKKEYSKKISFKFIYLFKTFLCAMSENENFKI